MLPKLDQLKTHLKNSSKQLSQELEVKEKQHSADKKRYDDLCKEWQKLEDKLIAARGGTSSNPQVLFKAEAAHTAAESAMMQQENKYRNSVTDLSQAQLVFERQAAELMRQTEDQEIDRVKLMKGSFQQLAKSMSNTAPTYLGGMQRMLIFADAVDARQDVETFVHTHSVLKQHLARPRFQPHPKRATAFADYTRPGSAQFDPDQASPTKGVGSPSSTGSASSSKESFVTSMEGKTSDQKLGLAGRPDLDNDEPVALPEGLSQHEEGLLRRLLELSRANDFYGLIGAAPSASKSELAKARRQKTLHLHPDHFAGDAESKKSASEALSLLNQVYTDLLTKDAVRSQYDQLCAIRLGYPRLSLLDAEGLAGNERRLTELKNGLRKARAPAVLIVELEQALMVVSHFRTARHSAQQPPASRDAARADASAEEPESAPESSDATVDRPVAAATEAAAAETQEMPTTSAAAAAADVSFDQDNSASAILDAIDAAVSVRVEPGEQSAT
ncbi:uncharacterized protein LOC135809977 isoform X2 [Sycon ciliatum]